MSLTGKQILVEESFVTYNHPDVQIFIQNEMKKNNKKWIYDVISGQREREQIIFKTDSFILLPNNITGTRTIMNKSVVNLLVIFTDTILKTIRDLRGCHVTLLEYMLKTCVKKIHELYSIEREDIIAYFHYPPSVYQLHAHIVTKQFCRVGDLYRFHNIHSVISNLKLDPDYYTKIDLSYCLNKNSNLYFVFEKSYLSNNNPTNGSDLNAKPKQVFIDQEGNVPSEEISEEQIPKKIEKKAI